VAKELGARQDIRLQVELVFADPKSCRSSLGRSFADRFDGNGILKPSESEQLVSGLNAPIGGTVCSYHNLRLNKNRRSPPKIFPSGN
jgi:hypothetical protein